MLSHCTGVREPSIIHYSPVTVLASAVLVYVQHYDIHNTRTLDLELRKQNRACAGIAANELQRSLKFIVT